MNVRVVLDEPADVHTEEGVSKSLISSEREDPIPATTRRPPRPSRAAQGRTQGLWTEQRKQTHQVPVSTRLHVSWVSESPTTTMGAAWTAVLAPRATRTARTAEGEA